MPAGTWNLGRLRKRADYVGLKDLGISLIDRTVSSDNYFNITEFPAARDGIIELTPLAKAIKGKTSINKELLRVSDIMSI